MKPTFTITEILFRNVLENVPTDQWLSPNAQLVVILASLLITVVLIGIAVITTRKYINSKLSQPAPFWAYTLNRLTATLTHDEYPEMDELMKKANENLQQQPDTPMDPEEEARLLELMAERAVSDDPMLRPEEQAAAKAFPGVLEMARLEAASDVPLTDTQLVSSQAPVGQTQEEKADTSDASKS